MAHRLKRKQLFCNDSSGLWNEAQPVQRSYMDFKRCTLFPGFPQHGRVLQAAGLIDSLWGRLPGLHFLKNQSWKTLMTQMYWKASQAIWTGHSEAHQTQISIRHLMSCIGTHPAAAVTVVSLYSGNIRCLQFVCSEMIAHRKRKYFLQDRGCSSVATVLA